LKVINSANLTDKALEAIETQIPSSPSLADVVNWGLTQRPSLSIDSVVTPDEYTHDIVMRWRENLFIVLGTT
jgi:hypothetical protein